MTMFNVEMNGEIQQIEDVKNYQALRQRIEKIFAVLHQKVWNIYYQYDGDKISIDNQDDFQNMIDGIQSQKIPLFVQCEQSAGQQRVNRILEFEDATAQQQSIVQRYDNHKEDDCERKSSISESEQRIKFDAQLNATYAISQIRSYEQPTNNLTQSTQNLMMFIQDPSLANDKANDNGQITSQKPQKMQSYNVSQQQQDQRNCEVINRLPEEIGQSQNSYEVKSFTQEIDQEERNSQAINILPKQIVSKENNCETINKPSQQIELPQDTSQKDPIKTHKINNIWERILANQCNTTQIEQEVPKDSESPIIQNCDTTPANIEAVEQRNIYESQVKQDTVVYLQKQDACVQTMKIEQIKNQTRCVFCGNSDSTVNFYIIMHSCILCEICQQNWKLQPKWRPFKPEEKI